MQKSILITGATDGIGLETAKMLAAEGHQLLLHGRNPAKLAQAEKAVTDIASDNPVATYLADLSSLSEVEALASAISENHTHIDVLINNAGILKTPHPVTKDGMDVRFVVNTFAPYLLTQKLMPLLNTASRVVNLSSAAQATVNLQALAGNVPLADMDAYAQSKLAITMWSRSLALAHKGTGPIVVAVNPGSLLASKMVKEGFGVTGNDLSIGAGILCRAALSDEFADASGQYFDNDAGQFAPPHADALDAVKTEAVVAAIEQLLANRN